MEQRHIVIADDEELLCVIVADLLRDAGYRVTTVSDGSEVLPVLEREQTDLVLLDLMMPTMNGIETLTQIKKKLPETRVIMISGFGTDDYILQSEQLGSDGFINKPFGVETLMRHIKSVLANPPRPPFKEPPIGQS